MSAICSPCNAPTEAHPSQRIAAHTPARDISVTGSPVAKWRRAFSAMPSFGRQIHHDQIRDRTHQQQVARKGADQRQQRAGLGSALTEMRRGVMAWFLWLCWHRSKGHNGAFFRLQF